MKPSPSLSVTAVLLCLLVLGGCSHRKAAHQTFFQYKPAYLGLELTVSNGLPEVTYVDQASIFYVGKILSVGDRILELSKNGFDEDYVRMEGVPIDRVKRIMGGQTGTELGMKILHRDGSETHLRIPRMEAIFPSPSVAMFQGFNPPSNPGLRQLDPRMVQSLKQTPLDEWARLQPGMRTNEVIDLIGSPLRSRSSKSKREWVWDYGVATSMENNLLHARQASIWITNGVISENMNSFETHPALQQVILGKHRSDSRNASLKD